MKIVNQDLSDKELIKFLKRSYHSLKYLSEPTINDYIRKIPSNVDNLSEIFNPARKKYLNVLNFWERLLTDAIKFLKWHDLEEIPPKKNRPKSPDDVISEGSLGVYALKDFFKAFMEFEGLLYGAEQFYRDHVLHLIRVWLTGEFLIGKCFDANFPIYIFDEEKIDGGADPKYISDVTIKNATLSQSAKNKHALFKGEESAIWCIIALTHDLGYPLGKIEKINESLKKMMRFFAKTKLDEFFFSFPLQNQFINDAILKYVSSKIVINEKDSKDKKIGKKEFNTHMQAKFYLKFSRSFERFDHGIISCIVLAKNLVYFLETNYDFDSIENLKGEEEARQFIIRREILRAIASHTCHEIYHFKHNTFSFLLLLVDELQFWGRPTFDLMRSGNKEEVSVKIKEFSDNKVAFVINAKPSPGYQKKSLCKFFKDKVDMFNKILRIGVDSYERKFTLSFKVNDAVGGIYEFIASPRKHPLIKYKRVKIEYDILQRMADLLSKGEDAYKKDATIVEERKLFPV